MKDATKPNAGKSPQTTKAKGKQRPLNLRQETFCELVVSGISATQAYMDAGYPVALSVAKTNGPRLLDHAGVKARIIQLRKPQTKAALRKKEDNLRFLADAIGTPLSEIGPDSPLCVEYTEEIIGGGSRGKLKRGNAESGNETVGETILRRRVKKVDPLRALELYSRLLGHFEPDRVEVEAGPRTLITISERAAQVASALGRRYGSASKENA